MSAYDDIIRLPYPRKPQRMSNHDRAAQFAPFAALTGYDAAIAEASRVTEGAVELGEDGKSILDRRLRDLEPGETVTVTYFRPDNRKSGGAYIRYTGRVRKADPAAAVLLMSDGTAIPFARIREIEK